MISFKESTKYNGYDQYSIYPSFEWKKETKIKNDKFGFSLPEGWETVPGSNKKNLVLYGHDYTTTSWSRAGSINTPCSAALTGYAFDGFDEHCLTSMYYKGNAFFYAYKKNTSASDRIRLSYCHDPSSAGNISFSISVGVFSFEYSGSHSKIEKREDSFEL